MEKFMDEFVGTATKSVRTELSTDEQVSLWVNQTDETWRVHAIEWFQEAIEFFQISKRKRKGSNFEADI